ncbi:MAG: hypothetical protein B9S38_00115 [Verrucomicrobiia bacterium Tous-C4TDCM]|nr:MAG: hypothetical protein B9S38_00115 [Verrucomicrobiae bacterium Tous-C4TDCM]
MDTLQTAPDDLFYGLATNFASSTAYSQSTSADRTGWIMNGLAFRPLPFLAEIPLQRRPD